MAKIDTYIPKLLHLETGKSRRATESVGDFYLRSRIYTNKKSDMGGATTSGVTLATYKAYRKKHGKPEPTINDLKMLPYAEWSDILKEGYWDKCKADDIKNQSVAEMMVDWCYISGTAQIKKVQRIVGVTDDGMVGAKTIAAINAMSANALWSKIKAARLAHIASIVRNTPSQRVNLKGWTNRINYFIFHNV